MMAPIPQPVLEYLNGMTIGRFSPAWLRLDVDAKVTEAGGKLEEYGIERPVIDRNATEFVLPLEGILPTDDPTVISPVLVLPMMHMKEDRYADIHVFPAPGGYWIVLLDCTNQVQEQKRDQQIRYDLYLKAERNAREMTLESAAEPSRLIERGVIDVHREGEYRRITALCVDIRGECEFGDPEEALRRYSEVLSDIAGAVFRSGGVVDRVDGCRVVSVFGLGVGTEQPTELRGVAGAEEIVRAVMKRNQGRPARDAGFAVSIGVTTGDALVGVVKMRLRRIFCAIGGPVETAKQVADGLAMMEIGVDESTFEGMGALQTLFRPREHTGPDGQPITTHVHRVKP